MKRSLNKSAVLLTACLLFSGIAETLPSDSISASAETVMIAGYKFTAEFKPCFYFADEETSIEPSDLITSLYRTPIYSDGTEGEPEQVTDFSNIYSDDSPSDLYDETYQRPYDTHFVYEDETGSYFIDCYESIHIAEKGDVTLDGKVNAEDASVILLYAAAVASGYTDTQFSDIWSYNYSMGYTDEEMELFDQFIKFTGDVWKDEDESVIELDARDAASLLVFAAHSAVDPDISVSELWSQIVP